MKITVSKTSVANIKPKEKTMPPLQRKNKAVMKKVKEVISEIKIKPKVIVPEACKTIGANKDKIVAKKTSVTKRKLKPEKSALLAKKQEESKKVKKNTVLSVKKKNKDVMKKVKEVVSDNKNTPKVIVPEVCKTTGADNDKMVAKKTKVLKGKLKLEKSKLLAKKPEETKEVKVKSESGPVSLDIKNEDQNVVAKPREAKIKRKSSVISNKDLKPISNIKSLVKKPPKKISKAQIKKRFVKFPERGACYFSHIPHGFYEKELKKYCSQFGEVTGVYHPVSRLGNSRGYAFVEFKHKEVAEVVAETMNNYLMYNRLMKCQYIPPEAQKPWVFRQERNNMKVAAQRRRENLQMQMRNLSKSDVKKWKKRRQRRVDLMHKKLAELGVDYEFQVNDPKNNAVQQETKNE